MLGEHDNQTSGVLSDQTDAAGSPSNVAVLTVLEQVTHTKTFVPDLIHIDGTSRMKVVLTNTNAQDIALSPFFALFDFFPRLPDIMEVADTPDLTNTCGATVLSSFGGSGFNSGSQLLLVRGGAVPANSSCEISFNVKVNGEGTYTNTTNGLSTELGYDPGASDDLVVHTGFPISGRVYHDSNMDGNNDATEKGISALPVVLFNRDNNSCISTRTDADGNYRFSNIAPGNYQLYEASRETVPTPQNCDINTTKDPATYRSTTANVFTPFVMAHEAITGKDFGDVSNPTFTPNHAGSILPDNVIFYAHQFTAKSTGNVTMRVNSSGNATIGWSSVLYQDSNCNGQLDGVEANSVLSSAIPTVAEQDICVLNKVYAPANVSDGETINHEITAEFDFNNNAFAGTTALTVIDITKAAANEVIDKEPEQTQGSSRLELRKTVENITQGTAETDTRNQAKPNDVLRYRIYYRNSGTGVITDLKINDVIPTFTRIIAAPSCDLPLPDSLTRCDGIVIDDNNLEWYFGNGDILQGGSKGVVRYDVIIE